MSTSFVDGENRTTPLLRRIKASFSGPDRKTVNDLLPFFDCIVIIAASCIATTIYSLFLTEHQVNSGLWTAQGEKTLIAAVLAAFFLHGSRSNQISNRLHLLHEFAPRFMVFIGLLLVLGFATRSMDTMPRAWAAIWLIMSFGLTWFVRQYLVNRQSNEVVAIVGAGPVADRLIQYLQRHHSKRVDFVGVFDDRQTRTEDSAFSRNGTVEDLIELGKTRTIDWILLTLPCSADERLLGLVHRLKSLTVSVGLCPQNVGLKVPYQIVRHIDDELPVAVLADSNRKSFNLDDYALDEFLKVAAEFGQSRFSYAVTPNVDHLIRLHEDPKFRDLYDDAGYVLLDSRFLSRMLHATQGIDLPVCAGSDLTQHLFSQVITSDDELVLIGGTTAQAAELTELYGLKRLHHHNPPMGFIRNPEMVEECLRFIESHSPFRFCLLAVGSPQQELLAQQLQARDTARGLALCVGASIDFITGIERRAPLWMQQRGLEWSYRLSQSPARLAKRYLLRGPRIFRLLGKTAITLRPGAH